ncbi:hypothetical protein [Staphylothermus hellenicus]|uniref:Uncharacterized protein n=1 Tax=Staphylothermus hellenicus (strain DSM 12710 / JCM 10830 / BK20S6-10-b1 / P8) TaxID=591019 RepID=D7DBJ7_STAHD|nr:hypothetical protein [Staphylothermus hellenicus]ADI31544.1 hypothetical protein Shell_0413 [Staphylothermus hellenicus DSM 12710]
MNLYGLKKIREILELIDTILGIISQIIVYLTYIYLILLIRLSISTIMLRIILWRRRLPNKLRKRIIEIYEDKALEMLDVMNLLKNVLSWNTLFSPNSREENNI